MLTKLGGIGLLAAALLLMGAGSAQAVTFVSGAGIPWAANGAAAPGCGGATGISLVIGQEASWVSPPLGSSWISCADNATGAPGGTSIASGGIVTFTQTFALPGFAPGIATGSLDVAADDTGDVTLNGHDFATAGSTLGSSCVNDPGAVTCGSLTTLDLSPYLLSSNTLTVDMRELDGNGSGALWAGSASVVPEPATLALIAPGMLGLTWLRRRGWGRKVGV